MTIISRILALILGLVGCAIAFIVDISYSTFHRAVGMLGDANLDRTHGFIGFGLVLVGLVGSILALFSPIAAAILLLIAGIGLFFVVKGFAVFSILFFVLAAVFAFLGRHHHHRQATPGVAGS
ncbi:MAG: hypothetical protein J2P44_04800 [Candidatus Dormibacteraeota bacterium]|nr:hypothetical protein [Candidatus Dormibacteraeota bacterium]